MVQAVSGTTYVCTLQAEDTSGNVAQIERVFVADNQAPAAPTGLNAVLEGVRDGRLTWQPNMEADLAGYLLYLLGMAQEENGDFKNASESFLAALACIHIRQQDQVGLLVHDARNLHYLPPRARRTPLHR